MPTRWERLLFELQWVDGPRTTWRFVRWRFERWFKGSLLWQGLGRFRATPPWMVPAKPVETPAFPLQAECSPDVKIAALGARSRAVFAESEQVARTRAGHHVDVVVADTAAETAGVAAPAVTLDEALPLLSVPCFDPVRHNPIGCDRVKSGGVGALGPLDLLPAGCKADRVVRRHDRAAFRKIRHLEDVEAFHADPVKRAGELARLTATGVVVHLADEDRRLAPYVGAELFELMTREVRDLGFDGREALSVRMRRAALREHSLGSRARQVAERALADPPRLPLVSILMVTRRPKLLERVLATVRQQTYPRLELILGLHGEGFGEVSPGALGPSVTVTVLRLDAALPLGSALNAATQASRGTLLAKMDDDDLYGPDHVWDLVLAHEYSQAPLVGKEAEFVYLAASDRTIRRFSSGNERHNETDIAGAALLITRRMLDHIGGWKPLPLGEDRRLIHDVMRAGGRVHRTHPYGFLVVRHGQRPTWEADDAWYLASAKAEKTGFRPDMADLDKVPPPQLRYANVRIGRRSETA